MIVFILQFGSGDIFQRLMGHGRRARATRSSPSTASDVYQSDLTRLAQTRTLVNQIYIGGPVRRGRQDRHGRSGLRTRTRPTRPGRTRKTGPPPDQDDSLALRFALQQWKEWNDPQNPQPADARGNEPR